MTIYGETTKDNARESRLKDSNIIPSNLIAKTLYKLVSDSVAFFYRIIWIDILKVIKKNQSNVITPKNNRRLKD